MSPQCGGTRGLCPGQNPGSAAWYLQSGAQPNRKQLAERGIVFSFRPSLSHPNDYCTGIWALLDRILDKNTALGALLLYEMEQAVLK